MSADDEDFPAAGPAYGGPPIDVGAFVRGATTRPRDWPPPNWVPVEFDVHLEPGRSSLPYNRIDLIRLVRAELNLGLREAVELVDKGGVLREGVRRAECADLKTKFEKSGAVIRTVATDWEP